MWTQADAIELCRLVEAICPAFGCHVALTGGLLYKDGPRKDCDLLLYTIRQADAVNFEALFAALGDIGLQRTLRDITSGSPLGKRFVIKAAWRGKPVDILFPEAPSGDYETNSDRPPVSSASVEDLRGWSP